jgi:hypothetical protein
MVYWYSNRSLFGGSCRLVTTTLPEGFSHVNSLKLIYTKGLTLFQILPLSLYIQVESEQAETRILSLKKELH